MWIMNSTLPVLLLATCFITARANCPWEALVSLPFVLEYALWRGWDQAIIYTPNIDPSCSWAILKLVKCLSVNGVAAAVNSTSTRARSRLGAIVISPRLRYNATKPLEQLVKELQKLQMGTESYEWLLTTRSDQDFRYINNILNKTSIRFDQNIIVAYPTRKHRPDQPLQGLCDNNFSYKLNNPSQNDVKSRNFKQAALHGATYDQKSYFRRQILKDRINNEFRDGYYRSTERFKHLVRNQTYKKFGKVWPLFNTGVTNYNYSRTFQMINVSRSALARSFRTVRVDRDSRVVKINLVQYFRVRINTTLYAHYLGVWTKESSMSDVEEPYPVEARNFLGEDIVVGRCNFTGDGTSVADDEGPSAPASLDDILHFITVRLNATSSMRFYSKLGFRTYEGTWTGLLGALMDNSVDIALEPVTVHTARNQDMDFIFPIAETM